MARKPLTPAEELAMNDIRAAAIAYKRGKDEAEIRIRREVANELAALEMTYALALRRGRNLGISIARLGQEGMGTHDFNTPRRWLAKTDPTAGTGRAIVPASVFTWIDRKTETVKVRYPGFVTTARESVDYPAVLEGVIRRNPNASTGWEIVEDPGNVHLETGDLPGWLTWEIESVPTSTTGSITSLLNEWADPS